MHVTVKNLKSTLLMYFLQMRQNQLRHEDEIMRLKEQLSDAQRFVLWYPRILL